MLFLIKKLFSSEHLFTQSFFNNHQVVTDKSIIQAIEPSICNYAGSSKPHFRINFCNSGRLKILSDGTIHPDQLIWSKLTFFLDNKTFRTKVFRHPPSKAFIFLYQQKH